MQFICADKGLNCNIKSGQGKMVEVHSFIITDLHLTLEMTMQYNALHGALALF